MGKMRLYIWSDPYSVPYGSSMVFAVAPDLRAARKIAAQGAQAYTFGEHERPVSEVAVKLGKPTRVLDLPCAEWHEWRE